MVGKFVISKAGHDKGQLYVILAVKNGKYLVSDGRLHPVEKSKCKNPKHVQMIDAYVQDELLECMKQANMMEDFSKVQNHEIKYAIRKLKGEKNV